MADFWLAGEGALWWQPDGPNTEPLYLGTHDLGNIDDTLGDIQLLWNPDPSARNKWKVVGSFQKAPSPVKTSIKSDVQSLQEYLERTRCPGTLYVMHSFCGRKNVFGTWDRMFVLEKAWITKRQYEKLSSKVPDDQDRAVGTYDITSEIMQRLYRMTGVRLTLADAEDGLDIANYSSEQCASSACGDSDVPGSKLLLGTSTLGGSVGNVANFYKSIDKGASWVNPTLQPFTGGQKIMCVESVDISDTVKRILVGCGTTAAGAAAKVSYSDNGGTTWTASYIGTTNALFLAGAQSLLAIDYYHVWAGLSDGSIWKSSDGGATWVCKSTGLSAQNILAIMFSDERYGWAVGKSNTIYNTIDGGDTWQLVSGPTAEAGNDVNTVYAHSSQRVWIGYSSGTLYYTRNGGDTWVARSFPGSPTVVANMDWLDEYVGMIAYTNAAGGNVSMTWDGGVTWEDIGMPANGGISRVLLVSNTLGFAVGSAHGGTTFVAKIAGG